MTKHHEKLWMVSVSDLAKYSQSIHTRLRQWLYSIVITILMCARLVVVSCNRHKCSYGKAVDKILWWPECQVCLLLSIMKISTFTFYRQRVLLGGGSVATVALNFDETVMSNWRKRESLFFSSLFCRPVIFQNSYATHATLYIFTQPRHTAREKRKEAAAKQRW